MLCSSDVNGGMEGDAGGGALTREDEWIQWALLGIALDDDDQGFDSPLYRLQKRRAPEAPGSPE